MTNKITNWIKADEVSEEGLYLIKRGDVATKENTTHGEVIRYDDGELGDDMGNYISDYADGFFFALLEF